MRGTGFLAIWSDVEAHDLTDYRHWLTREHTTERVTTKGFFAVRVFRAERSEPDRFFILYELESPKVLDGPAYLARLNAPSPWSSSSYNTKMPSPRSAAVHRVARRKPGMPSLSGKCSWACQCSNSGSASGAMSHHMASAALPDNAMPGLTSRRGCA